MTRGPLHEFLQQDHARLDELLRRTDAGPTIDLEAYREFRSGLLRHMAMEEKVLLTEARRLRGGEPLLVGRLLRADHAALAALLVPPPTHELMAKVREVLIEHNPLEEDPGGLYEVCDQLAGPEAAAILSRLQAVPEVRMAPNTDGPRPLEHIEALLEARRVARGL
jgi:hypothetical protein